MRMAVFVAVIATAAALLVSASMLPVDGGVIQWLSPELGNLPSAEEIPGQTEWGDAAQVTVQLRPDSLRRGSNGAPLTAYVGGIDAGTGVAVDILLCTSAGGCIPGVTASGDQAEASSEARRALLTIQFGRQDVSRLLQSVPVPSTVELAVSWRIGETAFIGTDQLTIVDAPSEEIGGSGDEDAVGPTIGADER